MDHFFSTNNIDTNYTSKISLDELYDRKREVQNNRLGVYNKILERVHTKIKTASRQLTNNNYIFFIIPEFIFGVPKYNTDTCTSYIIDKLQENGFIVKYTHPNFLFISWNHYIPSYEREKIKKETGITIDGFGNEIKSKNIKDKSVSFRGIMKETTDNSNVSKVNLNSSKDNKNYKDISTYKPHGIYNLELINKIQDKIPNK